jgi:LPXTG-site transpeptidase (sortase) family protein
MRKKLNILKTIVAIAVVSIFTIVGVMMVLGQSRAGAAQPAVDIVHIKDIIHVKTAVPVMPIRSVSQTPPFPSVTSYPVLYPPVSISIPRIDVRAKVIPMGVTPGGILDTPHNFVDVGWYRYGTMPGDIGSAVIDGHVDNGASIDGVFKHLNELKPGDDIQITTVSGSIFTFKVAVTDVYTTATVPMETILRATGARMLRIITCHGTYIPQKRTYDERLVVTAILI